MTPWEPTQRLGQRYLRVAIFIAAEQEPSATLTAKRMHSDALEQLLATDALVEPPMQPYLIDVQASILRRRQTSRPAVRVTGEA